MIEPGTVLIALLLLNAAAFAAFGIDKSRARAGERRVSEATLLTFALLGGTAGAYAGRRTFRHKTRKQPFSSQLHTITVLQLLAMAGAIGWWLAG